MSSSLDIQVPDTEFEGPVGKIIMLLLQTLLLRMHDIGNPADYPDDFAPTLKEGKLPLTFDFIIVGGGTAGCILANRLTEVPKWKVLVLEAGITPSKTSEVPYFYQALMNTPEDWAVESEIEEDICQGMSSRACSITQGKALGGTSSINNMHYGRASKEDWEEFDALNNTWIYENLLPYFRKLENFQYYNEDEPYPFEYGVDGSISLTVPLEEHPMKSLLIDAVTAYSNGQVQDDPFLGFINSAIIAERTRQNFAKIFFSPIKTRENLFVSLNSSVEKILISCSPDNKAVGVLVNVGGTKMEIRARREVIISAGPINSPKLLMLSGIGPKELLEKNNITALTNLDVGKNLHSHYSVPIFIGIEENWKTMNETLGLIDGLFQFLVHKRGPFTETGINTLYGFISTRKNSNSANIGIELNYFQRNSNYLVRVFNNSVKYCHHIVHSLKKHSKKYGILVISPQLLKPRSRGVVELKGNDSSMPPLVKNNFFSDENNEDLAELELAFKFILQIVKASMFKEYGAKWLKLEIPACRCSKFGSDSYISCYIKNMGYPTTSIAGTVKIGPICERSSVLNEDLVVRGFRCLRVVDSSVLPTITATNTLGTVAILAEKTADMIRNKWEPQIPKCPNSGEGESLDM